MRAALLFSVLVLFAACGKNQADGQPSSGSASPAGADEQARFDADRKPEKLVEALGIGPGSRVADVGAGSGLITVHLARAVAPGGKVVATDVDASVLDLLKQRIEAAGLGDVVERRVVAADKPGLDDGGYDAILLAEVDHYFPDPVRWLASAAKALKPGGRIVISNRNYHRAQSMDAARKAGLVLQSETNPVPTHFVAVFVVDQK
ncbi:MAG: methyltransferase domain-containing protein [Deltaproteobacteria bacterium]|nr:methyltransferase domain-containing protein [Deltaproteobacteria bacterium]